MADSSVHGQVDALFDSLELSEDGALEFSIAEQNQRRDEMLAVVDAKQRFEIARDLYMLFVHLEREVDAGDSLKSLAEIYQPVIEKVESERLQQGSSGSKEVFELRAGKQLRNVFSKSKPAGIQHGLAPGAPSSGVGMRKKR